MGSVGERDLLYREHAEKNFGEGVCSTERIKGFGQQPITGAVLGSWCL